MHKQPVYCRVSEKGTVKSEKGTVKSEKFATAFEKGTVKSEKGTVKSEKLPSGAVCLTYDNSVAYVNGVSEAIFKVGMCLPAGPYVTDDDVRYIVDTIKDSIL